MKILNFIDSFLNKTPMYKLVIYALLSIIVVAFGESFLGLVSYSPISLLESLALISIVCIATNFILAKSFKLPLQYESSIITALIMFLILLPVEMSDISTIVAAVLASVVAMGSKYFLVYRNTHIFNPAAIGLFSVTLVGLGMSFWWVGSIYLLPIVLLSGLLIVRKTRRSAIFVTGVVASVFASLITSYFLQMSYIDGLYNTILAGPAIFFICFMITEPHTIAKNKFQQILYTSFIILLPAVFSILNWFAIEPELSLLVGNVLSFIFSYRQRFVLKLKSITNLSDDIVEYNFENTNYKNRIFNFIPGEFMEWLVPHTKSDIRGMRRYFTISSAPVSDTISFATKYPPTNESSYKHTLKDLKVGDTVYATQLNGEFLLPSKKIIGHEHNLVMIAGGIGITPFISQIRDLLNKKEKRSIVLFYAVKFPKDIVYMDVLKRAITEIGIKVVCIVSDPGEATTGVTEVSPGPGSWGEPGVFYESGFMSKELIQKYTQNLHNQYYISGPNVMVDAVKGALHSLKIENKNIHTDYFPGY